MDEIRPLSFRPKKEESDYLIKTGKIDKWSELCHNWLKKDMKYHKKNLIDTIRSDLILIFIGVLTGFLGFIIMPYNWLFMIFGILLYVFAFLSISFGAMSLIWELKDVR